MFADRLRLFTCSKIVCDCPRVALRTHVCDCSCVDDSHLLLIMFVRGVPSEGPTDFLQSFCASLRLPGAGATVGFVAFCERRKNMCVAVVLFCVAFCSVFAFGVRVLWSICGVFVVGVFSATTFGRCLGSDAFHMTRLTVFSTCCVVVRLVGWFVVVCVVVRRASCRFHFVLHWVCCWHLRVHWLCVASISARDACATHVRHMCGTGATHVRHRCGACATNVRPPCDTRATHVRPPCDIRATHVRPMCDHHAIDVVNKSLCVGT